MMRRYIFNVAHITLVTGNLLYIFSLHVYYGARLQRQKCLIVKEMNSSASCKQLIEELSSNELDIKTLPNNHCAQGWVSESNSVRDSNTEKGLSCLGAKSCKDLHLSSDVKHFHESMDTNIATTGGTPRNRSSPRGRADQFDKDSEISQKQLKGHEGGSFVDYNWDDIGNFEELDKIFSNDDPIFRNVGLGGVDELWSASKDPGYSLENSFLLPVDSLITLSESCRNVHMQNNARTDHTELSNQPISDYDKMGECMFYNRSDRAVPTGAADSTILATGLEQIENDATVSSPNSSCSTLNNLSNKVNKQKKTKNRKESDHEMKRKSLLSPYSSHFPENHLQQFGKQEATSMIHSFPFSEHAQFRQGTGNHQSNKLSVSCESMYNQFAIVPILPQSHLGVEGLQQRLPGYEVSHGSSFLKTRQTPLKPLLMTPQEKIDKLRRRQQMQAMLAIKKQQQELGHKEPDLDIDRSVRKNHFHETQIQTTYRTEKDSEETTCIHPYYDLSCSSEKETPNKASKAVNEFTMENSVLSRLQDIIAKLDSQVRLCIRDSLFRLATSAAQRHYPCDTCDASNESRNENCKLTKGEFSNYNRSVVMVDAETETNPVDRIVAHLLFHRTFDVIAKTVRDSHLGSINSTSTWTQDQ